MFEVYRAEDSPLKDVSVPSESFDRFTEALQALTLESAQPSWAHDRNGSSFRCFHINTGLRSVEVNSFTSGDRFLAPLVPVENWPDDLSRVGHIFRAAIQLGVEFALSNDQFGDGTELKIYTPRIVRNGDSSIAETMLAEQLAVTLKEREQKDIDLPLQVFARGKEVQLS